MVFLPGVPVSIDSEKCIGCGACAGTCPNVFALGASGKAEVRESADAPREEIQPAIDGCPVGAIAWKA